MLLQYCRLYSIELYYGYLRINVKEVKGNEGVLILGIIPALVWNGSGRDALHFSHDRAEIRNWNLHRTKEKCFDQNLP